MYRIAICEDENIICTQIESAILIYGQKKKKELDVQVYYSGEELYAAIQSGISFDLIFLDIELRVLNGIEVGKKIRDELKNETIQIVYISAKQGYAMDLFDVRPLHFLIKPLSEEQIANVLGKMMELRDQQNQCFEFQSGKDYFRVPIQEILYFESMGKKIHLVTAGEDFEFYGKLADVAEELEDCDFLWIHKSYLVHYLYIAKYKYESVTMVSGKELPISRSYRKSVREALMKRRKGGPYE